MSSKRLKRASDAGFEDLEVDMSPMIDMVFLLLIFFMVNAVIIDYRKDKKVEIPISTEAKAPDSIAGRVIVNVYNDAVEAETGTRFADEHSNALDEAGITELVSQRKALYDAEGLTTSIHLRADRDVNVEYTKRAIKAAGAAGVINVVFSTYNDSSAE